MIKAFGGADSNRGNTGPFWVGSGLAVFSALITFFFIKPLSHDGMMAEDAEFREYLRANGYDTDQMGLTDSSSSFSESAEKDVVMNEKIQQQV